MLIRPEQPQDVGALDEAIASAFGQSDESDLVRQLRADGDMALSLVAEDHGEILGHIALSKMTAPFAALALAPLAVLPHRQNQGIGSSLSRQAIQWARGGDWAALFVLGEPAYYQRFGFNLEAAAGFSSPYAGEHFMGLILRPPLSSRTGALIHAPAFGAG